MLNFGPVELFKKANFFSPAGMLFTPLGVRALLWGPSLDVRESHLLRQ